MGHEPVVGLEAGPWEKDGLWADPGVHPNTVLNERYLWGTASTQLTNTGRVTFQHRQLLSCCGVPDLHEALVRAHSHQVPLGVNMGIRMSPQPLKTALRAQNHAVMFSAVLRAECWPCTLVTPGRAWG